VKRIEFTKFYKFCPICGARLGRREENLLICDNSHQIYINPKITNAVIFENARGQIMLVRRRYPPHTRMWDLPGGFVDLNENMEESARREIKEELGIEAEGLEYVASSNDTYEYQGLFHPTICITFKANAPEEKNIKVTDDIEGYRYFDRDSIPFDDIGFASMRKVIERYLSQLSP